jgi:RHS repeat-associated protein
MLTTQFRHDLANRLIGITYPSGLLASYTRDAQGRVSAVSLARGTWALPLVTQVGYQPFGPMSSIAFGHGQTLAKQWDRNYEPDAITSPAIDYDYTLDDVGNLTRIQSAIEGEQRYGYDSLDRLESIREQNEALIESFAYDATGNRTSHTVGASTTSYSYPGSSHRLEQVGAQARAFDVAGNTVSGIAGSSFAFDARNRLVEVNAGGSIRQRMNYNGRGERVLSAEGNPAPAWPTTSSAWGQAAAAGVRATVYDEQGQVLSTLRGGNPLRFEEIVWIDSTPVARVESSTSAVLTVHAIHTDHLNTPRALVNAQTQGGQPAGTVVWRWRLVNQGTSGSNAFGAMAAEEDPDGNGTTVRFDLRFPGQQYDATTGLHYNYFRDYEAQTGRYVESDPIGLRGGVSTYRYANSSPIVYQDPDGLLALNAAGAFGGGIAGGITGGLFELTIQFARCNRWDRVDWWGVSRNAFFGALTGAFAGATLGAGTAFGAGTSVATTGGRVVPTATHIPSQAMGGLMVGTVSGYGGGLVVGGAESLVNDEFYLDDCECPRR